MTFNNHAGSTRSYDYVREHNDAVNRIDFITPRAEITVEVAPGRPSTSSSTTARSQRLRKLHADYDPRDRVSAMARNAGARRDRRDRDRAALSTPTRRTCTALNTSDAAQRARRSGTVPGSAVLDKINAGLR